MSISRTSNSNVSTDWAVDGIGGPMTQNEGRGVSPPSIQDGFGLTASGLMHYVRPRPQLTTEQTPSSTSNP